MTALLEVRDLAYQIKKKNMKCAHLAPVNFTLGAKETLAIIGASSSGKSTLANLIAGILQPTGGVMLLNGQKLGKHNFRQRCKHIRMIFQHAKESINPAVTIGQLLNETLRLNTSLSESDKEAKIIQTLRLVGLLPDHASFYPNMLSDGQLQRIAIARALILDPQVIIADEPLAALDPSVKSQIVNLLLELQHRLGIAYVFISHNLAVVKHISDRVLVMKNGEVIEDASKEELFKNPQHEYTKRMLESYNLDAFKK